MKNSKDTRTKMSKTTVCLMLFFFENAVWKERYLFLPILKPVCEENIETPSMPLRFPAE